MISQLFILLSACTVTLTLFTALTLFSCAYLFHHLFLALHFILFCFLPRIILHYWSNLWHVSLTLPFSSLPFLSSLTRFLARNRVPPHRWLSGRSAIGPFGQHKNTPRVLCHVRLRTQDLCWRTWSWCKPKVTSYYCWKKAFDVLKIELKRTSGIFWRREDVWG